MLKGRISAPASGELWAGPLRLPVSAEEFGETARVVVRSYDVKIWVESPGIAVVERVVPLGDRVRVETTLDGAIPLFAVIVSGYVPPVPVLGVPASVAVPSLLFVNVTPAGKAPVWLMAMDAFDGNPVVSTVNEPAWFVWKVALFALVMAGAWFTVSVKFWVALGGMPLLAVMTIG